MTKLIEKIYLLGVICLSLRNLLARDEIESCTCVQVKLHLERLDYCDHP